MQNLAVLVIDGGEGDLRTPFAALDEGKVPEGVASSGRLIP